MVSNGEYMPAPQSKKQQMGADFNPVPEDYADRMADSLKQTLEFPGFVADNMSRFREADAAAGGLPEHTRYGWVRKA